MTRRIQFPCICPWRDAYILISLEPVPSQNGEVPGRRREGNWNPWTAPDSDATEPSSSFLKSKWWEVEVATDLILHLENISEVLSRSDWTVSAINSILPWVPSLLYAIPVDMRYDKVVKFNVGCSAFCSIPPQNGEAAYCMAAVKFNTKGPTHYKEYQLPHWCTPLTAEKKWFRHLKPNPTHLIIRSHLSTINHNLLISCWVRIKVVNSIKNYQPKYCVSGLNEYKYVIIVK